jgi:hypothetical protein
MAVPRVWSAAKVAANLAAASFKQFIITIMAKRRATSGAIEEMWFVLGLAGAGEVLSVGG